MTVLNLRTQRSLLTGPRGQDGMTLIEILIVIALIALIGTFVGGKVMQQFGQAKVDSTKIQIRQIGTILDQFKLDCGRYPLTNEGLDALVNKPEALDCKRYQNGGYMKEGKVPQDPFAKDWVYTSEDGRQYELKSLGQDGLEGGEGENKDISSKNLDE